jgi:hypothetical protein
MTSEVHEELVSLFNAIIGDRFKLSHDDTDPQTLAQMVKDLSEWSDLFTICPRCQGIFLVCPWCSTLLATYDEFCEHGFACLGVAK